MKVAIITEGGGDLGFGHITRCTALYQAFAAKNINPGFFINLTQKVKLSLPIKNIQVFNWLENRKNLFTFIKNYDIALIDSYQADTDFYNQLAETVKKCAYLDDFRRINYPPGLVINPTINISKDHHTHKKNLIYLLGPKYITLRKAFWTKSQKKINENINSILITFGGNDVCNLSPLVLNFFTKKYPDFIKNVIIGGGYRNVDKIVKLKDKKTNLIIHPDAQKMKNIMISSDIAISSGGQTLYELANVGLPTLGLCIADNQLSNLEGFKDIGFIKYLGWYSDKNIIDKLQTRLHNLDYETRKNMHSVGQKYVDGLGAKRIVSYLFRNKDIFN